MDSSKKKTGDAVGSVGSAVRRTPVRTTPPVTLTRRHVSPAVSSRPAAVSSTGTGGIKVRKNILPVGKLNPTDLRIKGSAGGGGTEPIRPMYLDSGNRTLRFPAPDSSSVAQTDQDEEALDILYSRYLQKRLMAQAIAQRRQMQHEANAKRLADLGIKHIMRLTHIEPLIRSVSRILKEAEKLEKLEALEHIIVPFMQKICEQAAQDSVDQIARQLSAVLDVLSIRNGKVPPEFKCSSKLSSISQQLHHVSHTGPLSFADSNSATRCNLQQLAQESTLEEKELNENLIKLLSLILGQLAIKRKATGHA